MCCNRAISLDDYGCSAGGHHEHGTIGSDGLVVDVDADNSISSKSLGTLCHLVHGRILGLDKYFLVRTAASAEEVGNACHEVLKHIGTNNDFACHHTLVFTDGATFNLWGSWTSQASRARAVDSIIIVLF